MLPEIFLSHLRTEASDAHSMGHTLESLKPDKCSLCSSILSQLSHGMVLVVVPSRSKGPSAECQAVRPPSFTGSFSSGCSEWKATACPKLSHAVVNLWADPELIALRRVIYLSRSHKPCYMVEHLCISGVSVAAAWEHSSVSLSREAVDLDCLIQILVLSVGS